MDPSKENIAIAYCLASSFYWDKLVKELNKKQLQISQPAKEIIYAISEETAQQSQEFVVFEYGCVIFFNSDTSMRDQTIKLLQKFAKTKFKAIEQEIFTLSSDTKTQIHGNKLILKHNDLEEKVGISYAITQSVKLSHYENTVEKILGDLRYDTTALAKYGRVIIGRSSTMKKTGQIFLLKAQINLYSDLLDTPDYFWDRQGAEKVFLSTKEEMDMQARLDNLNKRLDMMQELYEMLAEQIKHGHFIMLEVTIVILISIEVVYTLTHWWGHP